MSQIIDGTDSATRDNAIAATAEAVQRGEVVVIPTDTVYGVGADAFDPEAVVDLLAAKGRGKSVPPPVLVPTKRTLDGLATGVPKYVRRLVEKYWPGPLTIVLRAQSSLMWDLGDTNGTVALRMPNSDLALAVLSATGPMAVTSANRHGRPPSTTAQEAHRELGDAVSVYLDGGPSELGLASTIIDCTGAEMVVLREGSLTERELRAVAFGDDQAVPVVPDEPGELAPDLDADHADNPLVGADADADPAPADAEPAPQTIEPAPVSDEGEPAAKDE